MEDGFGGMPESFQMTGSMTSQGLQPLPQSQTGLTKAVRWGYYDSSKDRGQAQSRIIVINLVSLLQGSGTRDDDGWKCMSADVPATGFVLITVRFSSLIGRPHDTAPSAGIGNCEAGRKFEPAESR